MGVMKLFYKIHSVFDGVRIQAVFLSVICLVALLSGLRFFTVINNEAAEYRLVKSNTLGRAYYFCDNGLNNFLSPAELYEYRGALKEFSALDCFFTFKYAGDIMHFEKGREVWVSVLLLDPGFYNCFPLLKSQGLDFSKDPDGCVIGSRYFNIEHGKDQIDFKFWSGPNSQVTKWLTVCGRIRYPFRFVYPSGSGTNLRIGDMLSQGHVIIMQDTDNVRELIEREPLSLNSFILTVKDDADENQVQALIDKLGTLGTVKSFDDMLTEARENLQTNIKNLLPRPLFNLLATLIAYLSMVVLMVRKKQKDMAVAYLCGASKGGIIATVICTCCIVSFIPCLITALILLEVPKMEDILFEAFLTPDLVWVVAAYFAVTVIVAVVSVAAFFAGHSPMENLRGLE